MKGGKGKEKGPSKGKGNGIYDVEAENFDPWSSWAWGKSGMNLGNPADKEDVTIGLVEKDDESADEVHEVADKVLEGALTIGLIEKDHIMRE